MTAAGRVGLTGHSAFALLVALSAAALAVACGTTLFDQDLLFFTLAVVNSIGLRAGFAALVDASAVAAAELSSAVENENDFGAAETQDLAQASPSPTVVRMVFENATCNLS
jgi:hypothetical protein